MLSLLWHVGWVARSSPTCLTPSGSLGSPRWPPHGEGGGSSRARCPPEISLLASPSFPLRRRARGSWSRGCVAPPWAESSGSGWEGERQGASLGTPEASLSELTVWPRRALLVPGPRAGCFPSFSFFPQSTNGHLPNSPGGEEGEGFLVGEMNPGKAGMLRENWGLRGEIKPGDCAKPRENRSGLVPREIHSSLGWYPRTVR